jgi:hypothetical protein
LNGTWRKSTKSPAANACVEARRLGRPSRDPVVQVRDSKDQAGPVLTFSTKDWQGFVDYLNN